MYERLLLALSIGLPLGAFSAFGLIPLARVLPSRLSAQGGGAIPLEPVAPQRRGLSETRLDWILACGLCITPVIALLAWGLGWFAFGAMVYCAVLQTLARIDWQTYLLPDLLTLPLLWAGLLFHLVGGWVRLEDAVAGAAVGYGVLWLIWAAFRGCTGRDGMGFGDLKLAAANGAWLGLEALPWTLLIASSAGSVIALCCRLSGRLERGEPMAFGPYLALAGILMLFWAQSGF